MLFLFLSGYNASSQCGSVTVSISWNLFPKYIKEQGGDAIIDVTFLFCLSQYQFGTFVHFNTITLHSTQVHRGHRECIKENVNLEFECWSAQRMTNKKTEWRKDGKTRFNTALATHNQFPIPQLISHSNGPPWMCWILRDSEEILSGESLKLPSILTAFIHLWSETWHHKK